MELNYTLGNATHSLVIKLIKYLIIIIKYLI